MKMQRKPLLLLLAGGIALILAIIIVAVSCSKNGAEDPGQPISDAAALCQAAIENFSSSAARYYTVSSQIERIFENETFNENSDMTVIMENPGTESLRCSTSETLKVGSHTVDFTQLYADGTVYLTAAGGRFQSGITAREFEDRLVPAIPVTPELYADIAGLRYGEISVITLTQATAPESWLDAENAQLVSATATVEMNAQSSVIRCVYAVSYTQADAYIRRTVTVELLDAPSDAIAVPADAQDFTAIEHIDAPRMLEIACGYLLEANSVTSVYNDSVSCEAFGDHRTQSITVHAVNTSQWSSCILTDVTLSNSGIGDSPSTLSKAKIFTDGTCVTKTDGSDAQSDPSVTEDAAKSECQDILVGTIVLPQHISGTSVTETPDTITVTFATNEDFSQLLSSEASRTLYGDGVFLSTLAQSYETETVTCYLQINKQTGLPVASGFRYIGVYTIDQIPYHLAYSADQSYTVLHDNASAGIREAAGN